MKFTDFIMKNTPKTGDYVVGYDENTAWKPYSRRQLGTAGAAGTSVDVQYSANGSEGGIIPTLKETNIFDLKGTDGRRL